MLTFYLKEAMVLDLCKLDVGEVKGSRHKVTVRSLEHTAGDMLTKDGEDSAEN